MSEPMWMSGDTATFADITEDIYEFDCDCGWTQEVDVQRENNVFATRMWGEWTCTECNEHHNSEVEWDNDR